jgi:putative acetyltransferase
MRQIRTKIVAAQSYEQLQQVRDLFREYEAFLQVDLCFQDFERELASLPGRYAPPAGVLLIASHGDHAAGCAAMRKLKPGICEMKRLFVRPPYLHQGLGKQLALAVIEKAKAAGYSKMRLDTLDRLEAAIRLYSQLGFVRCGPYYDNPLQGVVYWELNLDTSDNWQPSL